MLEAPNYRPLAQCRQIATDRYGERGATVLLEHGRIEGDPQGLTGIFFSVEYKVFLLCNRDGTPLHEGAHFSANLQGNPWSFTTDGELDRIYQVVGSKILHAQVRI